MRRIDILIDQSRRATENSDFTTTTGIQDEEFIQYANDAQDRILSLIQNKNPEIFQKQKSVTCTAQQEAVTIPSDIYMGSRIEFVEYSSNGEVRNFYRLPQGKLSERVNGIYSDPTFYIRRSHEILLQPAPQSSSSVVRFTYQRTLPRLDIRRATISSVSTSGSSITSLVLDASVSLDDAVLLDYGYATVVSATGTVKMKSIPITAIDTSTGAVTLGTFSFESDEIIAAGDYLCAGPYSTTHCELYDICERYLISYMNWKILKRDSSSDAIEAGTEVSMIEADIVEAYSEPDNDIDSIPILDTQYLYT